MSLDERAPLHSVSPSLAAPRKRNNSGDMAGTASQEGGQDCSEVLAAAGRTTHSRDKKRYGSAVIGFFCKSPHMLAARYVPEIHVTAVAPNFPIAPRIQARSAR